jgi:hypothetical protein
MRVSALSVVRLGAQADASVGSTAKRRDRPRFALSRSLRRGNDGRPRCAERPMFRARSIMRRANNGRGVMLRAQDIASCMSHEPQPVAHHRIRYRTATEKS